MSQPYQNPKGARSAIAAENLAAYRIIKPGSTVGEVEEGAAATDDLIGITRPAQTGDSSNTGAESGKTVDYYTDGVIAVEYGGTVSVGDALTSDSVGRAVATTNAGDTVIGYADVAGVVGDIGAVRWGRFRY